MVRVEHTDKSERNCSVVSTSLQAKLAVRQKSDNQKEKNYENLTVF